MNKVKKNSVSDQVFEQLKNKIAIGSWRPGCKIPSENQLRELMGVSRVSIREAIHKLSALGVLETRHGEGTFVRESLANTYFNELVPFILINKPDIIKILEYRKIIEVGSIAIAIKNVKDEEIGKLENIVDNMNLYQEDIKKFSALDMKFHILLANIAGNPIVNRINYIIADVLNETMIKIVKDLGPSDGLYYHSKILAAVQTKDVEMAQKLMDEHIEKTITKISKINN